MSYPNKYRTLYTLLLSAFAVLQMACSTPPVEDPHDYEDYSDAALRAYRDCVERLQGASIRLCENIGTNNSYSYDQYSYGAGRIRGVVSGSSLSKALLDVAYEDYLRSLDPAEQERLAALWAEVK